MISILYTFNLKLFQSGVMLISGSEIKKPALHTPQHDDHSRGFHHWKQEEILEENEKKEYPERWLRFSRQFLFFWVWIPHRLPWGIRRRLPCHSLRTCLIPLNLPLFLWKAHKKPYNCKKAHQNYSQSYKLKIKTQHCELRFPSITPLERNNYNYDVSFLYWLRTLPFTCS